MELPFDYAVILERWEDYPNVKLSYDMDESGWAKQLDDQFYCIANVPLRNGLSLYDIVTARSDIDLGLLVDSVVQSYFTHKWGVRYPTGPTFGETERRFNALWNACKEAGGHLEGMVQGMAICNAPDGVDIAAVINSAGVAGVLCEPCKSTVMDQAEANTANEEA